MWRAFVLLVFALLSNNASAQIATGIAAFFASAHVNSWSDAQAIQILAYLYNPVPNTPITIEFRTPVANFNMSVNFDQNLGATKRFIEAECASAESQMSLCVHWTNYVEDYKNTIPPTYKLPDIQSGRREYALGACKMDRGRLNGNSASNPVRTDVKLVTIYGSGYSILAFDATSGQTVRDFGFNGGGDIAAQLTYIINACANPDNFYTWAKRSFDEPTIARHVRYSVKVWIENQPVPLSILSIFKPSSGWKYPDNATCTADDCPSAYGPSTGGGTSTSPPTTNPACTLSNGTTSGNPYDCAPVDTESNCTLFQPMCWLKKAFVPSQNPFSSLSDKLKTKIPFGVFIKLTSPTETCGFTQNISYMGQEAPFTLDLCFINTRQNAAFTALIKLVGAITAVFLLSSIARIT